MAEQDKILLEDLEKPTEVNLRPQEEQASIPQKVPLVDKTKQIEEKLESLKKTSSESKPRPSVEELEMDHKSRLNMWESKLKEPQRQSH